jgi:hypothetical protein
VKNLVNCQHLQFTETWRHSKFGCNLCKIRGEKPPRAFVKVVEGSEIYNFPIHHFVHFYTNFWGFRRSNRGAVSQGRVDRCRTCLGVCAPRAPSQGTLRLPKTLLVRARHVLLPYTLSGRATLGPAVRLLFCPARACRPRRHRNSVRIPPTPCELPIKPSAPSHACAHSRRRLSVAPPPLPWPQSRWKPPPTGFPVSSTIRVPPLGPHRAVHAARFLTPVESSPELSSLWPPPPATSAPPRRPSLGPDRAP